MGRRSAAADESALIPRPATKARPHTEAIEPSRRAALETWLARHNRDRHWRDGSFKPCGCRYCNWARAELLAAGIDPGFHPQAPREVIKT